MKTRWSILALTLLALGCGRGNEFPTVRVTGNVTVDGAPVDEGTIDFVPLGAGQGRSTTAQIVQGAYRADVAPGSVQVYFHATRATGRTIQVYDQPEPERENLIPGQYRQGLEIEVAPADSTHDFNLLTDANATAS